LLAPLARDDAKLTELSAALQPFAKTGVASRAALTAEFRPWPRQPSPTTAPTIPSASVFRQGARRGLAAPVGADVAGDTTEAKLARAEAALNAGDVAKAVELLKSLPPRQTRHARPGLPAPKPIWRRNARSTSSPPTPPPCWRGAVSGR